MKINIVGLSLEKIDFTLNFLMAVRSISFIHTFSDEIFIEIRALPNSRTIKTHFLFIQSVIVEVKLHQQQQRIRCGNFTASRSYCLCVRQRKKEMLVSFTFLSIIVTTCFCINWPENVVRIHKRLARRTHLLCIIAFVDSLLAARQTSSVTRW